MLIFEVQSISQSHQTFHIGDISFKRSNGEEAEFIAISKGNSPPFTKFKEVEQEATKRLNFSLRPDEKLKLNYVVGAEKDEPPIFCSFQNGPWTELKTPKIK